MIVRFELQNCLMKKKKTQQSLHFEKNKTALNAVENVLPRQVELNKDSNRPKRKPKMPLTWEALLC